LRVSCYKQRHAIWQRKYISFLLPIFILLTSVSTLIAMQLPAQAAVSDTLNFQGRLLTNTGALVPDGSYNIEFRLYDADVGGVNSWTETRNGGNAVTVRNGYFSVYLGDVTVFPGTIAWDQENWLTMNVEGDGEMTPRFKLTAVPYAFRAGAITDSLGNAYTGDDLIQKAPATIQALNSALAAIRLNQTGAGGLLELQTSGIDVFTVANSGDTTIAGGLTLGTATEAGSLTLEDGSGNGLTLQQGSQSGGLTFTLPANYGTADQCLKTDGTGILSFGDCDEGSIAAATFYDSAGGATIASGVFSTINLDATLGNADSGIIDVASDIVTVTEDGFYEISYQVTARLNSGTRSGFNAKLQLDAGGGFSDVAGSQAYHYGRIISETQGTSSATVILSLSAGDSIRIQGRGVTQSFVTIVDATNLSIARVVGAGSGGGGGGGGSSFVQNGNAFGSTAILGTTDTQGLNIIVDNSNALTFTSAGAATFTNGLALSSGDLTLGGGNITAVGDITAAGGLTLSSGGGADLTLDSASDVLILSDSTLRRSAAGTTTIDLLDAGAGTTLEITNSDATQVAGLTVEGAITASSLSGAGSGLTGLNASNILTGTIADGRLSTNVALLNIDQTFTGQPTFADGLILGNTATTTAGALRWTGTDFEGYDGAAWVTLTGGGNALLEGVLAFGKVAGDGTPLNVDGASIVRNGVGDYTVTLDTPATSANYTVLLTVEEPAATLDDTKISIDNQTTATFDVDIHEGDNGGAADVRVDRVWHFTVLDPDAAAGGGGGGGGTSFSQGGNSFGAEGLLGTTDANGLDIITNGSSALAFTSGGAATFSQELTLNGRLLLGSLTTPDVLARAAFNTGGVASKGLVIQGVASQAANLLEFQDSTGSVLSGFNSSGDLFLGLSIINSSATISRSVSLPDASGTICLSGGNCGYLELASGSFATDATTNNSIAINKTGASGNLLALQKNGGAVFTVSNTGALQIQNTSSTALDIRNVGGTSFLSVNTTTGVTTIGALAITNGITGAGLADCTGVNDVLQWDSGSSLFSCRDATISMIQVYDNAGGTNLNATALTAVPFGAETRKLPGFTHDNVTLNSRITLDDAGWYRLDYNVSAVNGGNGRITLRCEARLNGVTSINQSASYSYQRNAADNNATNTAGFVFETTGTNEYIEILCQRGGSAGTSNSIANETWVVVEKR